jgi:competence protein ComEA
MAKPIILDKIEYVIMWHFAICSTKTLTRGASEGSTNIIDTTLFSLALRANVDWIFWSLLQTVKNLWNYNKIHNRYMSSLASRPSPPAPNTCYIWLLRRADQAVLAMLVLLALAAMGGWWISQGGLRNRLVEANQAQRRVADFQVDINAADWPELIQLPGIGDTLAKRIIETRQTAGPFAQLDDLRNVKGIGPKIMERLRPYLLPLKKDKEQGK